MPWFSSNFLGITRTTTLTCQRSQVGEAATLVPCDIRRDELTRHAHCLIAPTGRTRRDPDHCVPATRQVVAGESGGQRIRTSTGLPPAVFKTAALPVRSSPPERGLT